MKTKTVIESANTITAGIVADMLNSGYSARRVNVTGIYKAELMKFIDSGMEPGFSDIICCMCGLYVGIEVKFGKDRMSKAQHKFKKEVEDAVGVYVVVKTWAEYLEWKAAFSPEQEIMNRCKADGCTGEPFYP